MSDGDAVRRALSDLEVRLRKARSPLLAGLRPGLTDAQVARLFKQASLKPDQGLVALYRWHDGAQGGGTGAELLVGARFMPLEEALSTRKFELDLAAETEFPPDIPAELIFDSSWWPILVDASGRPYVVENLGAGRVLLIDREQPGKPEELGASLVEFLNAIARDHLDFKPPPPTSDAAVLVARLESSDQDARQSAVRELSRKKPAGALEPLIAMLNSADRQARIDSALLLGALGDRRAIPALIRSIAHWTGTEKTSARAGLAAIGREGELGHLEKALSAADAELRIDAIKAIAITGDARAVPALQAAASGDSDARVRQTAQGALRAISEHG